MSDKTNSLEINRVVRLEVAHTGMAPRLEDIDTMYALCKRSPDTVIYWVWKAKKSGKTFTLSVRYPLLQDTGWWDYEVRDDPDWKITDDRELGNNEIWKQKTCDTELVLLCCDMAEARFESHDTSRIESSGAFQVNNQGTRVFSDIFGGRSIYSGSNPDENSIPSTLKECARQRFSGRLRVFGTHATGNVYFEYGMPVHAVVGNTIGDTAFHEIVTWGKGRFSFKQGASPSTRSISKFVEILIAEASGLLELKRFLFDSGLKLESLLHARARASIHSPPDKPGRIDDNRLAHAILQMARRPCTLTDIIRMLDLEPYQWAPLIASLIRDGELEIRPPVFSRASLLSSMRRFPPLEGVNHALALVNQKTGILKFEALLYFLEREFAYFRKFKIPLSLLVLDIKKSESSLGTKWLDEPLVQLVAKKLEMLTRPLDLFTGFEISDFALLLPATSVQQAENFARLVVSVLEECAVPGEGDGVTLSVTSGLATIPDHGDNIEALLTKARQSMQFARENGLGLAVDKSIARDEKKYSTEKLRKENFFFSSKINPDDSSQSGSLVEKDFHNSHILFGELLIEAGVVSNEQFENAVNISRRTSTPLARVLALHEIGINRRAGEEAEKICQLVQSSKIDFEEAVGTIKLICNEGLDLLSAMRRMALAHKLSENRLFEFLSKMSVVDIELLQKVLYDSANTGLPLSFLVVSRGLTPRSILHDALDALNLIERGGLSLRQALSAMVSAKENGREFRDELQALGLGGDQLAQMLIELRVSELMVMAGLINDSELVSARENALLTGLSLNESLITFGFVDKEEIRIADKHVSFMIEKKLSKGDTAELLRSWQMKRKQKTKPK